MILYNASTSNGLRNFTRFLTNSNTSNFSDADLDAALNSYYDVFVTDIIQAMDEWDFQAEYATTDLVTAQQEYTLPTDILKIKRVEVTFDGTTWREARPMDINEKTGANDTLSISQDFSTNSPYYDLMDESVFLYPIPTAGSTAGLKVWYEKLPTELTNATDEPNFARPFHKVLAYGAAKDFFEKYLEKGANQSKVVSMENNITRYTGKMRDFYRKRNQDRQYIVEPNIVDYDYGNDY